MLRCTAVAFLLRVQHLAAALVPHGRAGGLAEVTTGELDGPAAELAAKVDGVADPFAVADTNHDGQVSRAEFKADVAETLKKIHVLATSTAGAARSSQGALHAATDLGRLSSSSIHPLRSHSELPKAAHASARAQIDAGPGEPDDRAQKLAAAVDEAGDPFQAADTNHDGQISKAEFKADVAKAVRKIQGLTRLVAGKASAEVQPKPGPHAGSDPTMANHVLLQRSARRFIQLPTWQDFGSKRGLRTFDDPETKENSEIYGVQKWIWVVLADCLAMLTFCACIPVILTCAKKKRPNFPG